MAVNFSTKASLNHISRVIRQQTWNIREKRKLRLVCTSAQTDKPQCFLHGALFGPRLFIGKFDGTSQLEQSDLNTHGQRTPSIAFRAMRRISVCFISAGEQIMHTCESVY